MYCTTYRSPSLTRAVTLCAAVLYGHLHAPCGHCQPALQHHWVENWPHENSLGVLPPHPHPAPPLMDDDQWRQIIVQCFQEQVDAAPGVAGHEFTVMPRFPMLYALSNRFYLLFCIAVVAAALADMDLGDDVGMGGPDPAAVDD